MEGREGGSGWMSPTELGQRGAEDCTTTGHIIQFKHSDVGLAVIQFFHLTVAAL